MSVQKQYISIRSSLWFVPALAILFFVGLAMGLIEADERYGQELQRSWPRFFHADAEGARAMLSTIAGSIATIAGVAFSITIVALVLASSQYTSRVLRTFMRDRATQLVLGIFVGVYIYCLLVLHSLAGGNDAAAQPLSIMGGLVLALVAIGFFIFFIHHISASIQASEIVAAVTRETLDAIDLVFPEKCDDTEDEALPAALHEVEWRPVAPACMGYIETVDMPALCALAEEHDVILKMERVVGDFVAPSLPIVSFAGNENFSAVMRQAVEKHYAIDTYRSIEQDPGFGIRQLVDIALKALSPGINDTTTAGTCIEHLSVILMQITQRQAPSLLHHHQGKLRLIARMDSFEELVALSFNEIIENAKGNTEMVVRLIAALTQIASVTTRKRRQVILLQWLETIEEVAPQNAESAYARDLIKMHINAAQLMMAKRAGNLR